MTSVNMSEEDIKRVDTALNTLAEHFDCVRIFASKGDAGKTQHTSRGMGNYFTQVGHIRYWLNGAEEADKHEFADTYA